MFVGLSVFDIIYKIIKIHFYDFLLSPIEQRVQPFKRSYMCCRCVPSPSWYPVSSVCSTTTRWPCWSPACSRCSPSGSPGSLITRYESFSSVFLGQINFRAFFCFQQNLKRLITLHFLYYLHLKYANKQKISFFGNKCFFFDLYPLSILFGIHTLFQKAFI